MKKWTAAIVFLAATCFVGTAKRVDGQLHWPDPPTKTPTRVRLIALAFAAPRSTFFSSHEVFVAESEAGFDEWNLIKLVYTFLPYQPRLLETGFDYSLVHEVSVWRNTDCDETVAQLTTRSWPNRHHEPLIYARDVPRVDLDRRRIPLPCYETTADDYSKADRVPVAPPPPSEPPVLKDRTGQK